MSTSIHTFSEIPEWVKQIAINDSEITTVEDFKIKYMYRPTHSKEWHEAVLNTMHDDVDTKGFTMISNHSSITKSALYFIPK